MGNAALENLDTGRRYRVLLVDDESHFCFAAGLALRQSGMDVFSAGNGLEALEMIIASMEEKRPFDMIITDIVMPVMDGIELIDNLKRQDLNIPTLVITGFLDIEYREALQIRGINHTLEKPFLPRQLIEAVKGVIRNGGRDKRAGRLTE